MTEPAKFPLTQLERKRVLDGNPLPLVRTEKPALEIGGHVIVVWSRERRHCDKDGTVFVMPAEPKVWITVTKITRRRVGGWSVRYDITDRRERALMLARGSGYTSDAKKAIDRDEAELTDKDRLRLATEAKATHAERVAEDREKSEKLARAQIRSMSEMLRAMAAEAARRGTTIDPLLAQIVQQIKAESKKAA